VTAAPPPRVVRVVVPSAPAGDPAAELRAAVLAPAEKLGAAIAAAAAPLGAAIAAAAARLGGS
jgi:hypothetical protein